MATLVSPHVVYLVLGMACTVACMIFMMVVIEPWLYEWWLRKCPITRVQWNVSFADGYCRQGSLVIYRMKNRKKLLEDLQEISDQFKALFATGALKYEVVDLSQTASEEEAA